jgi:hypothetical protein
MKPDLKKYLPKPMMPTETVTIRVPANVKMYLERLAQLDNVSFNAICVAIFKKSLEESKEKH